MQTDELTGKYEVEDNTENALAMIGVIKPREIVQQISGFVPVFDALIDFYKDHMTAIVFGRRWQFCRMADGVCRASLSKIAKSLSLDEATVMRHTEKLVNDGFLIDLTPDRRNRPHVYADAGRVVMKSQLGVELKSIAQSNTTVAQSNTGIAESQLIKDSNKDINRVSAQEISKDEDQNQALHARQEELKDNLAENSLEGAIILGKPVEKALNKQAAVFELETMICEQLARLRYNFEGDREPEKEDFRKFLKAKRKLGQELETWVNWWMSDEWRVANPPWKLTTVKVKWLEAFVKPTEKPTRPEYQKFVAPIEEEFVPNPKAKK